MGISIQARSTDKRYLKEKQKVSQTMNTLHLQKRVARFFDDSLNPNRESLVNVWRQFQSSSKILARLLRRPIFFRIIPLSPFKGAIIKLLVIFWRQLQRLIRFQLTYRRLECSTLLQMPKIRKLSIIKFTARLLSNGLRTCLPQRITRSSCAGTIPWASFYWEMVWNQGGRYKSSWW